MTNEKISVSSDTLFRIKEKKMDNLERTLEEFVKRMCLESGAI